MINEELHLFVVSHILEFSENSVLVFGENRTSKSFLLVLNAFICFKLVQISKEEILSFIFHPIFDILEF